MYKSINLKSTSLSSADLQWVGGLDVNTDHSPVQGEIHLWPPDLLIMTQLISAEEGEHVSSLLVTLVIEGQAAGHGGCGHR